MEYLTNWLNVCVKKRRKFCPYGNKIYNEGEWPEEFIETVLLPIPKKNNAKKCKEFRTISLILHTARIILKILIWHLRSKVEEEQFGFRKGKGTRDAIGLIRTIRERYIESIKMCMQYLLTSKKDLTEWIGRNSWGSWRKLVWIGRRRGS